VQLLSVQRQNYIDVATGSLGQGLSVAAGMAYCGKYYDNNARSVLQPLNGCSCNVYDLAWQLFSVSCC